MKQARVDELVEVTVEKLVHGGQGLGTSADGKKVFLWNVLPGETVMAEIRKSKKGYSEGIATEIISASKDRIAPKDEAYLSTSPWQIMTYEAENQAKQTILEETYAREHVTWDKPIDFRSGSHQWQYRNKMEYSFWADDDGLHLALFHRASHGKRIISGSSIAMPDIDITANKILDVLNKAGIRGTQLKTIVLRADQAGHVVVALFVKDENFPELKDLKALCKGIVVCFSNPKSPASVLTKQLYCYGDISLCDMIRNVEIRYDVHSFFQVNLETFRMALDQIADATSQHGEVVDMYAGVGTIGLAIGQGNILIESDPSNCRVARENAQATKAKVIEAPAERALDYIASSQTLVVDPPRAGLHQAVIDRIRNVLPPRIVYLSCNPITQARDIALLQDLYRLEYLEGYNFFPRTPHIEALAVMIKS